MGENLVVTIGRQCGSRGGVVGMKLAETMGVKCYDKELPSKTTRESGLYEELLEARDERPTNSSLCSLMISTYSLEYITSVYMDMSTNHEIFLVQFDTIRKLAEEKSCVIMGYYGNYMLANYSGLVSMFITGGKQDKIDHLRELYDTSESRAKDTTIRTDKKRTGYYNYYANKERGDARSYNLCTNSSSAGVNDTVHITQEFTKVKQEHSNSLEIR